MAWGSVIKKGGGVQPVQTFTISYSTQYGTAPASKNVNQGYALTAEDLAEISAEGHRFDAWFNQDFTVEYTEGYIVNSNITLYAKWDTPITGVFGVNWLGTEDSSMTRTDDAVDFADPVPYVNDGTMTGDDCSSPFDNIMPWSGMIKVEDAEAGTLVKIPKYWYKWTRTGDNMKLQICNDEATALENGFLVSPAHADRGDGVGERDFVYVGRYHCSSATGSGEYKSTSGVKPKSNITRSTARSSISSLGSTIWQLDYAMFWTVNMLYLVEYANWDSQAKIGYGCGNGSASENSGKTDSMPYHTGTMQSAKTTYGTGIQYRYIEDWWANVYDFVDGIRFAIYTIYGYNNPSQFSDSSGGVNVGTRYNYDGYIKSWTEPNISGYEYFLYTSLSDGLPSGESVYVSDVCYTYNQNSILVFGGNYTTKHSRYGAFFFDAGRSSVISRSGTETGCRLQKLPSGGALAT